MKKIIVLTAIFFYSSLSAMDDIKEVRITIRGNVTSKELAHKSDVERLKKEQLKIEKTNAKKALTLAAAAIACGAACLTGGPFIPCQEIGATVRCMGISCTYCGLLYGSCELCESACNKWFSTCNQFFNDCWEPGRACPLDTQRH